MYEMSRGLEGLEACRTAEHQHATAVHHAERVVLLYEDMYNALGVEGARSIYMMWRVWIRIDHIPRWCTRGSEDS